MHHTAHFRGSQCECGLLNYFQRNSERHWPITVHTGFERFAIDQFHGIEALAVLFSVISHPSNVWMMNVRSGTRFAQKPRARAGILRNTSVDDLQRNDRIQNRIASAVGYGHLPDQRRCWPLQFSMIRDSAGGGAKAMCAELRLALRVGPQPPPDSAA